MNIDEDGFSIPPREPAHNPVKLFEAARDEKRPLFVCAPMVRYSKLAFRSLVRDYGTDLVYTPMMLAKEFLHPKARAAEFGTSESDRPLVVQFGAADAIILGKASEIIAPYADGIGVNCGCPQTWACREGLGAHLMGDPQLVTEMIRQVKSRCGEHYPVSVKIRIHKDLRTTLDFVRSVQGAGVDWIDVHGRRKSQSSKEPANLPAMKLISEHATVPVVANGDVFAMDDALRIAEFTGAAGVMAARGLLLNPALFAGYLQTPWPAVERFLHYQTLYPLHYRLALHHLIEMLSFLLTRKERAHLNTCKSMQDATDWIRLKFPVIESG